MICLLYTSMNQLYGDAANVNGRTYKYNQRIESFTANQLLTYSKAFGHHNIDIMAIDHK